ncbi:fatty acid synthase-like [Oppia nitens]|uniref:fatty acid synthase-like n=1 Tax=Oppia nitens TaxID=1686743 RepID=UPI0023DCCF29|nr:fatty acid synthase-like [Oppia nitens]
MSTNDNDIVISGMSGRFPLSDNIDEFADNLYNGIDMITEDDTRWPLDLYGMCQRMGKVRNIDKFDGFFFGLMQQLVDEIDPQSRILLETTYEAIVDAGINPQSLRGSRTGVYIGVSLYACIEGLPEELQPDLRSNKQQTLLQTMGNQKGLQANRVSYVFDFKGPSMVVDTACSASLAAVNLAVNDLKLGNIDYAIVGGTHMTFEPFVSQIGQEVSLCSPRGVSAVLDQNADGFVKADGVASVLMQHRHRAKRVYGQVLASRLNIDGKKTRGMFFPSAESQQDLMVMTYKEANVDPLTVNYIEAHCTGTRAGDPQEVSAIYNAYCALPGRREPLPLGLLKSNIGHTEGCSGMASIIKVLISFENECIPPNINLRQIKDECKQYCPPLYPNTEKLPYNPCIAGVNNFGIGGVNGHVLIKCNDKLADDEVNLKIAEPIPRIVNICGRTEAGIQHVFDFIEKTPHKITRDFLALLTDTMKVSPSVNSAGFPYRVFNEKTVRPVWLLFSGLGGQWPAMAKALMPIDIFRNKVEECHQILLEFNVDLKHWLLSEDNTSISTMTSKFCTTTAIELALFDVIKALDINVDGIIGHSFGEIACAYADGCLTTKEAMIVSYFRGAVTENDKKIPKGLMAVVGLSRNEVKKLCPQGVYVVCNNAKDNVVVSGESSLVKQMIDDLNGREVFVRLLESNEIPYHSSYLQSSAKPMTANIKKYLPKPRLRSKKWLSTAVLETEPKDDGLRYASAEYFVHNLLNPVHFYDKLQELPSDAIVIELGPHSVFEKVVKRTLNDCRYLSTIKKHSNDTNLDRFLSTIAALYELGLNPAIERLYPSIGWPVSRNTQSIGSLIRWDHKQSYAVRKYPEYFCRATASDFNFTINIAFKDEGFYADHCIDGNLLFPATGYLLLAWRHFAAHRGRTWMQTPVVFENIQFRRPVFLSESTATRLKVRYFENTGDFVILENSNVTCVGKVRAPPISDDFLICQQYVNDGQVVDDNDNNDELTLNRDDIYRELRIMGYDYGKEFQRLLEVRTETFGELRGLIEWNGNIITFLDSMLQSMALAIPFRKMMVPVMIRSLRIDPNVFFAAIVNNRVSSSGSAAAAEDNDLEDHYEAELAQLSTMQTDQGETASAFLTDSDKQDLKQYFYHRFYLYKSVQPFYFDSECRLLVSPGIEVENVMAFPIPRKSDTNDLKLDSYGFVANHDIQAIDDYQRTNLNQYLEICKSLAIKIKGLGLKHIKYNNNNNQKKLTDNELKKFLSDIQTNSFTEEFNISKDITNEISKNECFIRTLVDIVCENFVPKKQLKIVEINQTSCPLMAKEVEQYVNNCHIYTVDVDYKVVVKSKQSMINDSVYKDRAIEWDASLGGDTIAIDVTSADLCIVRDSPELWLIDLDLFVQSIVDLVVVKGFILVVFKYRFTEPEVSLNSLFDRTVSPDDADLDKRINSFLAAANRQGLALIATKCDSICSHGFLFRKLPVHQTLLSSASILPTDNNIISITSQYDQWFDKLKDKLNVCKDDDNCDDTVWLIASDGNVVNGILGLVNCLRLEPGGDRLRCLFVYDDDDENHCQTTIDFHSKPYYDIFVNDLVINVIKNNNNNIITTIPTIGTYRYQRLAKNYDKTTTDKYFLNISQTRDLSSLQWFDSTSIESTNKSQVFDINNNLTNLIDCNIYSSGLTFHDVLVATGRIPSGPQLLFTDCLIGCEFAGRRLDTGGERVMGFEMTRCFATTISANEKSITNIPNHWSMDDAVTILSTYSTVWYGLIERAHLKRNESILIHSGAGGVGQAAINICQYYNCDIYVTVGTEDKKQFLINEYNISENKIFSSRDIMFKYRILSLTKGKGVDLVLNSLAGEKLDASYECIANGGRFVELGKYDLVLNKQLGMFDFLRDISFIGVAVDICLMEKQDFAINFFDWMHKNSSNGCIKPLNRTVFGVNEAEKAFRYMTTGKHIGKVIIKIRDEESDRNAAKDMNPSIDLLVTTKTYFNQNKVYIITGGLGGCGLELVHWMLYMGAKQFILVSTNDCDTIESTKWLLKEAQHLGQIGGVFHLALVLNDSLLENQSYDKFCLTSDTKHKVFANLDQLTRQLDYKLDYFTVFSSVICGKGNVGQSNYAFGNSLCERICEQRRRDGLHGLAVQYGPIGDVGVFADKASSSDQHLIQLTTMQTQRINSCCEVLDKLLSVSQPIVTSYVRAERIVQTGGGGGNRQKRMVRELWRALGIDPETTPDHLTLGEIGMESMFAVELQQELDREWNIKMSINHVKNITIKMLKDYESGNVENIKRYVDDVRTARAKLLRYRFQIPQQKTTLLNNITEGKPVYFMPTFDGGFRAFEEFAKQIDRPVIGLNWTRELDGLTTMKQIGNYYIELLNSLASATAANGSYDIVGYFDGALISTKLLRRANIGRVVLLDVLSESRFNEDYVSDDYILEFIFEFISYEIPESFRDKIRRDMKSEQDIDSRIRRACTEIKEFAGKGLVATDLEDIIRNAFKRAKLLSSYRLDKLKRKMRFLDKWQTRAARKWAKLRHKLVVIKPFEFSNITDADDDVGDDSNQNDLITRARDLYFLPQQLPANDEQYVAGDGSGADILFVKVDECPFAVSSDKIGQQVLQALQY